MAKALSLRNQVRESVLELLGTLPRDEYRWRLSAAERGAWGRNTSNAVTIELSREVPYDQVKALVQSSTDPEVVRRRNRQYFNVYRGHHFLIQATFERSVLKTDRRPIVLLRGAHVWLHQAGQVISVGVPSARHSVGDLPGFIAALHELATASPQVMIDAIFAKGYENYGCA